MKPPIEREIVRTWVAPAAEGLSIAGHHAFRESLSPARQFDEIDEAVAAEDFAPSQRKSGKEISRLLDLLDSLPTGKDSQ
jgi:hypothetical protein